MDTATKVIVGVVAAGVVGGGIYYLTRPSKTPPRKPPQTPPPPASGIYGDVQAGLGLGKSIVDTLGSVARKDGGAGVSGDGSLPDDGGPGAYDSTNASIFDPTYQNVDAG